MENEQKPKKQIFKLIAIQPLDCAPCILKNLKKNEVYYFYKGYSIIVNGDKPEEVLIDKTLMNDDFYNIDESLMKDDFSKIDNSNLNVSIHTIVGKNGSGKSAIVELLMRVLNNIAYILHDKEKDQLTTFYPVDELEANLFYQVKDSIYKIHLNKLVGERNVQAICKKLNSDEIEYDIKNNEEKFLCDFFYTIVINYAIYAYNGFDIGDNEFFHSSTTPEGKLPMIRSGKGDKLWINNIMHKNDGYSAPLVIHPQRTDGNIDINKEKHLTISRLLSLFVKMDRRDKVLNTLNEKNEISKIQFTMDKNDFNTFKPNTNASKLKHYFKNIPNSYLFSINLELPELFEKFKQICEIIFKEWIQIFNLNNVVKDQNFEIINENIAYNYLVYKTMMIINRYLHIIAPNSKNNYHFDASYRLTDLLINDLNKAISEHVFRIYHDDSHITIKLKQTLNYIKYTDKEYSKDINKNEDIYSDEFLYSEFTPVEFSDSLNIFKKEWDEKVSDILYFMPPPFLKTKIYYKDTESKNNNLNEYPFDFLSSGEKQFTFFITTILYHLRNIESAHRSVTERRKYENVNLIFEEIELYFHPEMQRRLIDDIITSLRSMNFKHIKNINICLITHSPIILSDIPTSNGLFLKDGKQENIIEQTFASNIYSLFRNAFFIEGAPIGEFAVNKINQLCKKIENKNLSDSELLKEINQIGDPIIKSQVKKKYDEYKKNQRIIELTNENELLKKQLYDKNI